jgi:Mor family transcriptional regulator
MNMMKIMNKNGKDISFPFSSFMRRKKIKNNIYQEIEIARNQKDWVKLEILSKRYLNI